MSDQFDIPYKSDMLPKKLELGSKIRFNCYKGISCFNECCKRADVILTPYDVIRLKGRMEMGSTDFLREYTYPYQMEADGVPGIKLRTDDEGACRFLGEEGCTVYEDRPTACRYYPLGHLAMKPTDKKTEETHYFLIREENCKGHDEDRELTVGEYLQEQGVADYDEMNKEWLQILLKKRSGGPSVGRPSETSLQLFFMCSFDTDRFRRFVLSDAFRNSYDLEESVYDVLRKEDIALMKFGFKLMRQVLFGEKSIPEKDKAWEERLEKRKEVFELRRQAEIMRRQKEEDEKYKNDA